MAKEIKFEVEMMPRAKGRPQFGRGRAFTPAITRKAEEAFMLLSSQYRPPHPIEGPVELFLTFVFPCPKNKKRKMYEPHIFDPDLSNLVKLVEDAMNKIFWIDDNQVYHADVKKIYGTSAKIMVKILY